MCFYSTQHVCSQIYCINDANKRLLKRVLQSYCFTPLHVLDTCYHNNRVFFYFILFQASKMKGGPFLDHFTFKINTVSIQ